VEVIKWLPDPRDLELKRENYGQAFKVKAYHPLEVFVELGMEKIKEKMRRKLAGLKFVS